MAQMNISVPEGLKAWADARVAEGRYSSASDYVRDLIRRDQEQEAAFLRLKAQLDEADRAPETDITIGDIIAASRAAA